MIQAVDIASDLVQFRTRRRGWPSSCNVYLVRDHEGSVLVDTGLGVEPDLGALLSEIDRTLGAWGQRRRDLHTILLTHTHTDHAGGAVPIARQTGARVLLPVEGWTQAAEPAWQAHHILPAEVVFEVESLRDFDIAGHLRDDTMPEFFSNDSGISWQLMDEGDEVCIGSYRLTAHHMPGHDVGHLVWADLGEGIAFTGDMLIAKGTSLPWYPSNAGGVGGYLASLERLAGLALRIVCPGHGPVFRGAQTVSELVRETIGAVLARDERILRELLTGPLKFGRLDDLIYDESVRQVIPWASSVTMAHLRHLEQAGMLYRRPDGFFVAEAIAAARYLDGRGRRRL